MKTFKSFITLILIFALLCCVFALPASASSTVRYNVSYSAVPGNSDACSLPASVSQVYSGERVYFNFQIGNSEKLKSISVYIKTPGSSSYTLYDTERANTYIRYAYFPFTVGNTSGNLYYYFTAVYLNGQTGKSGECSISVKSNAGTSSSSWQSPMKNGYHTWGNGDSWGKNCNSYGRSNSGGRNYHIGIDLNSQSDSNVYAAASGTVVKSGWNDANGNYVVIQHTVSGKTVYSFYAHLQSRSVKSGEYVSVGKKIGIVGNSGSSAASSIKHLHFAIVDKLWAGSYYGYATSFSGNKTTYQGVTYYNPNFVLTYGRLP